MVFRIFRHDHLHGAMILFFLTSSRRIEPRFDRSWKRNVKNVKVYSRDFIQKGLLPLVLYAQDLTEVNKCSVHNPQ